MADEITGKVKAFQSHFFVSPLILFSEQSVEGRELCDQISTLASSLWLWFREWIGETWHGGISLLGCRGDCGGRSGERNLRRAHILRGLKTFYLRPS